MKGKDSLDPLRRTKAEAPKSDTADMEKKDCFTDLRLWRGSKAPFSVGQTYEVSIPRERRRESSVSNVDIGSVPGLLDHEHCIGKAVPAYFACC